jgi:hypothetical protein
MAIYINMYAKTQKGIKTRMEATVSFMTRGMKSSLGIHFV